MNPYYDEAIGTVVINSLDADVDTNQRWVINRLMDDHVKLSRQLNPTALGRPVTEAERQRLRQSEANILIAAETVDPDNISFVDIVLTGSEVLIDSIQESRGKDHLINNTIVGKYLEDLAMYASPAFIMKADALGFHATNFMKFILERAPAETEFRDLAREMIRKRARAMDSLGRGGVVKGTASWVDEDPEFVAELMRLGIEEHPDAGFRSVEAAALDSHWKTVIGLVLAGVDLTHAEQKRNIIISGFDIGEMKQLVTMWNTPDGRAELLAITGDLPEFLANQDRADAVRQILMQRAPHIGFHAGRFEFDDDLSEDLDDDLNDAIDDLDDGAPKP